MSGSSLFNGTSCSVTGLVPGVCQESVCQSGVCMLVATSGNDCTPSGTAPGCNRYICNASGQCTQQPAVDGEVPIDSQIFASDCFFSNTCYNGAAVSQSYVDSTPANLDASSECAPFVCSGGNSVQIFKDSTFACMSDQDPCTDDHCLIGGPTGSSCQHFFTLDSPCNDGLACTTNDRCSSRGCEGSLLANFSTCGCNQNGQCLSGLCVNPDFSLCDDGNPCTVDNCNATGCYPTLLPDGSPCPNSNDSLCDASQCFSGQCIPQPLPNGTLCSNGLSGSPCSSALVGQCISGSCLYGYPNRFRSDGYLIPQQRGPSCTTQRSCQNGLEYRGQGSASMCPQDNDPCVQTGCNIMGCCTRSFIPSPTCKQCTQAVPSLSVDLSSFNIINESGCLPFVSNSASTSYLFDIGFSFPFFDRNVSQFYLNPNGFIQFYDAAVPPLKSPQGVVFPNATLAADIVAIFWTALDPTAWTDTCISTSFYYDDVALTSVRRIDYRSVPFEGVGSLPYRYNYPSKFSFSGTIFLVESTGEIVFEYPDAIYMEESLCMFVTSGIQSATGHCQSGMFNGDGLNGFGWSSYTGALSFIESNYAIAFQPRLPEPNNICQLHVTAVPFNPYVPSLPSDRQYSDQLDDDQLGNTVYDIGFPFQLYGRDMSTFRVGSNGYVILYEETSPSYEDINSYFFTLGRPYSVFRATGIDPSDVYFANHPGFHFIALAAYDLSFLFFFINFFFHF